MATRYPRMPGSSVSGKPIRCHTRQPRVADPVSLTTRWKTILTTQRGWLSTTWTTGLLGGAWPPLSAKAPALTPVLTPAAGTTWPLMMWWRPGPVSVLAGDAVNLFHDRRCGERGKGYGAAPWRKLWLGGGPDAAEHGLTSMRCGGGTAGDRHITLALPEL